MNGERRAAVRVPLVLIAGLMLWGCGGAIAGRDAGPGHRETDAADSSTALIKWANEVVERQYALRGEIPELTRVFLHEDREDVRRAAHVALRMVGVANIENPDGLVNEVILPVLKAGREEKQILALTVLGEMGEGARLAVPFLLRMLREDNRMAAPTARALGMIGWAPAVIPELMRLHTQSAVPPVRAEVGLALGKLKVADAIPELTKDLSADAPASRFYAARALGMLGLLPENTVAKLIETVRDSVPDVRAEAVRALGSSGNKSKEVLDAVAQSLVDQSREVRIAAAQAAADLCVGRNDIVRSMIRIASLCEADRYWERVQAKQALLQMGETAIPALAEILSDSQFGDQQTAACVLAKVSERGAKVLAEAAKSDDLCKATSALMGMREGKVYADLFAPSVASAILSKPLTYHGLMTTKILRLRTEDIQRATIAVLHDDRQDISFRQDAAEVLGLMGCSSDMARRALEDAVRNSSPEVAAAARKALANLPK